MLDVVVRQALGARRSPSFVHAQYELPGTAASGCGAATGRRRLAHRCVLRRSAAVIMGIEGCEGKSGGRG